MHNETIMAMNIYFYDVSNFLPVNSLIYTVMRAYTDK